MADGILKSSHAREGLSTQVHKRKKAAPEGGLFDCVVYSDYQSSFKPNWICRMGETRLVIAPGPRTWLAWLG